MSNVPDPKSKFSKPEGGVVIDAIRSLDDLIINTDRRSLDGLGIDTNRSNNDNTITTTGTGSVFGSPCSVDLETPKDKPIQSFSVFHISPNSLIEFNAAQNAIESDKILEEDFVHNHNIRCCIYFLYGKEYCSKKSRDERVAAIKTLMDIDSGNLSRLCRVAFSDASDKISFKEGTFESYFLVASTARIFFHEDGAVGGFPRKAILRYQSSKCCYVVSVCVWLSLQHQRDRPNANARDLDPIDVAQVARRKIITDDTELENRVLLDQGRSAIELAQELTGRTRNSNSWECVNFEHSNNNSKVGSLAYIATLHFEDLGPGLVTNFLVTNPFFNASKSKQSVPGYWKFDGVDIDVTGEFVPLELDDKSDSERAELLGIWKEQETRFREQKTSRENNLNQSFGTPTTPHRLFNSGSTARSTPLSSEAPDDRATTEETLHSMVMLGWCEKLDSKGTKKRFIMMLNWWKNMPLVLVSPEYLQACRAKVYFLKKPLTETPQLATKDCLVGECSFPDNGEDGPDDSDFDYDSDDGVEGE